MREFGQYRIEALIGVGGMGEVHRAYDTRRERVVALKLLPFALSHDPEYLKRFRRESYTVARLREPHVIPIHDYGEIDGQLYIDMRLVDGTSLAMLLSEHGALSLARSVALVCQVAEALEAAHDDGLVHRDIKPSNILVTRNDFVYVVDFGIAHVKGHTHSALTMSGATLGTLDYMAPERFENRAVDCRTDVYSLSCVLYECLTATPPFGGNDLPALMYGHLFTEPPRPSRINPLVPATLDAVIAKGMAKKIEERYGSADEFAAGARAALADADSRSLAMAPTNGSAAVGSAPAVSGGPSGAPARTEASPSEAGRHHLVVSGNAEAPTSQVERPAEPDHRSATTSEVAGPPPLPVSAASTSSRAGGAGSRRARRTIIALAMVATAAVLVALTTVIVFRGSDGGSGSGGIGPVSGSPLVVEKPVPVAKSIAQPTVATTIEVGPTPGYLEVAPDGAYGYIANRAAGVITVFDTARNTVVGTIPVPEAGAQFITFSPDGARAYVGISNPQRTINLVGVLDTGSNEWVATIPVGVGPFAAAVTPDASRVYVPIHDASSVMVIDTATNRVTKEIEVAPNPHWVAVNDDGSRAWTANHESNVVSVIDTATDTVLGTVPVGVSPHSLLSVPGKPQVISVNYDSNTVSVIDTNTRQVIATIPTANHPQDITLSADGRHAYIATVDANAIQVLDVEKLQITATVPTGNAPTSVAVAPQGRQAYVTNLNDGTVTVLNVAGTA